MHFIHYLAQILVMSNLIIHLLAFSKNLASLFLHHKTNFFKNNMMIMLILGFTVGLCDFGYHNIGIEIIGMGKITFKKPDGKYTHHK
jgi:hypothetical protein